MRGTNRTYTYDLEMIKKSDTAEQKPTYSLNYDPTKMEDVVQASWVEESSPSEMTTSQKLTMSEPIPNEPLSRSMHAALLSDNNRLGKRLEHAENTLHLVEEDVYRHRLAENDYRREHRIMESRLENAKAEAAKAKAEADVLRRMVKQLQRKHPDRVTDEMTRQLEGDTE